MLTFMFKLLGRKSACKTFAGSNEILRMADPIFGSKYGPQNGVQNWITFSFLLLGLCLGPVLGSRFGPKSGASHRKILLLPADVLQADLRRTSMSVSVNTCFFSLCVPICFLYSMLNLRADALTAACSGDYQRGRPTTGIKAAQLPVINWYYSLPIDIACPCRHIRNATSCAAPHG